MCGNGAGIVMEALGVFFVGVAGVIMVVTQPTVVLYRKVQLPIPITSIATSDFDWYGQESNL